MAGNGVDKLDILYLAVYDPHVPYTGTGARGVHFVNFMARENRLDLVYMEGSGHPGRTELEKKFSAVIRGVRTKVRIPFSMKDYFLFSKALYRAACQLLETQNYDYILADYGLASMYGYKLSKRYGVPFIYCSHNLEYKQYLGKAGHDIRRWPLIPYMYYWEKKGCRKCTVLVPISDNDAEFYSRWTTRNKMVVVPQGFDPAVYNPFYESRKNDPRIVLFFGNYNISTNRDVVKIVCDKIADDVVKRIPRLIFQFVGANPPQEWKHPNFEFTGFVDSVIPYLQNADLVISPMLGGWGMPTKVIEALACGKPVVATEIGARAVPRHYSRLTIADIPHFAEMICRRLEENIPVDTREYEELKKEFLWENRLALLLEKMKCMK